MSLSFVIAGVLGFTLGVIQMLPLMRRRAEERGFSGSILIPFIFVVIGFVSFVTGVFIA